jgi:glycosyltransferase involved in cell wall biosynthesis
MREKKDILVVTPALSGGGWISLEEPINNSANRFNFTVVGLGPVRQRASKYALYRMPYFDYSKASDTLASIFPLNFLYNFPLIVMASFLIIARRPKIIIGNGFFSAYAVAFLAKTMGARVVISYHGCFEYYLGRVMTKIVRALSKNVDEIFVNSEGSRKDVLDVIRPTNLKVITVNHWAHDAFFLKTESDRLILKEKYGFTNKFVILYVGDISREKLVPMLLDTIAALKNYDDFSDFEIMFAGTGELVGLVKKLEEQYKNIKYLGYVGDREKLSELYSIADIVWSFGDTTYLARPAVEALASGTPIIIPDVSAVTNKALHNVRISRDIVPTDIGWLIDGNDAQGVSNLLIKIKRQKLIDPIMRATCRQYAQRNYGMKNIEIFVEALIK